MDCSLTAVGAEAFAKMFTDHRGTWMPHLAKLSLGYNRYRCRGQTAGATWCNVVPRGATQHTVAGEGPNRNRTLAFSVVVWEQRCHICTGTVHAPS
jgi:hypothetical protein